MEITSPIQEQYQIETMCRDLRIPVTPALQKHQLVNLICKHHKETSLLSLYSGELHKMPPTTSGICKTAEHSKI